MTVDFLVDFDSVTSNGNVLFVPTNGNSAFVAVQINGGGVSFGGRSQNSDNFNNGGVNNSNNNSGDSSLFSGQRYIAGVYDYAADEIRIYVDGVLESTASASFGSSTLDVGTIAGNTNPISIGASPNNNFGGNLDELAIYDRVLTASEIAERFNAIPEPGSLASAEPRRRADVRPSSEITPP